MTDSRVIALQNHFRLGQDFFRHRTYEEGLDVGWLTSIGYGGEVLVTPKDGLEN